MQRPSSVVRILIVEDNPLDVRLFKDALSGIRLLNEISFARTGEEALQFVREHRPELVILDTLMPLMDGFEVLDEIKSDPELKNISVIMATGDLSYVKKRAPLADGYIEKPIDLESLAAVVSNADTFAVAIVRT
ncbi:MAG: response regulator [Methanomassiliicoccales archaeon]|nr:response regulator [Methanomassiliicoccales archaeon]